MSKQILIFGATGNQGGSVAKLVLSTPELSSKYQIRAVTRDPTKDAAKALASQGAELVQADLDDSASLRKAIAGSHGVFALTNYWEHASKDREIQQGKNVVDASKAEGVKHLIWSSLASATEISGGELKHIPHFDGKAAVERYAESVKGSDMVASYYLPGFFMSNFKSFINRGPDGKLAFGQPVSADANYPTYCPNADTRKYVVGMFEAGQEANGARAQAVGSWLKPNEITSILSKAAGEEITFHSLPAEVFQGFLPEAVAHELTENMLLIGKFDYYGKGAPAKQPENDKWLYKGTKPYSFQEYVDANGPWKWE